MFGIVGPNTQKLFRRATLVTLIVSLAALSIGALRLLKLRGEVADLRIGIAGRQSRLMENRKVIVSAPKQPKLDALDRSRAVSKLRATLSKLAIEHNFSIDEFQASTDETPYLTVYASENKDPGWMQVPVRLLLKGRAINLAASFAALRDLDVPFEIDNVELTRRSTDNHGMAVVSEQVQLRVLVYRGEA